MAKPRGATSYRLSSDAQRLLNTLAEQLGVSKTAVLEVAIRKLARAELSGGEVPAADHSPLSATTAAGPVRN